MLSSLEPDCASEETVTISGGKELSILYYGNYGAFDEAYHLLGKKVREMNLKPSGYPRTLGIMHRIPAVKSSPINM